MSCGPVLYTGLAPEWDCLQMGRRQHGHKRGRAGTAQFVGPSATVPTDEPRAPWREEESEYATPRLAAVLPPVKGAMGRPMRAHRTLVEGAIYRYRTGVPWRDLPAESLADGVEAAPSLLHRRHVGQGPVRAAGPGRCGRSDRLALERRLDDRAGASAWGDRCEVVADADLAHRGLGRMTKIRGCDRTDGT